MFVFDNPLNLGGTFQERTSKSYQTGLRQLKYHDTVKSQGIMYIGCKCCLCRGRNKNPISRFPNSGPSTHSTSSYIQRELASKTNHLEGGFACGCYFFSYY